MKKYRIRLLVADDEELIIEAANKKAAVKKGKELNNTGYEFYDAMVQEIKVEDESEFQDLK
ncbi:MAG: hypothetical protein ACI4MA_00475 [Treponema sp.]